MGSIADADSAFDTGRIFVQHQSALTLLQTQLARRDRMRWLDLACGRGQILVHLRENLDDAARSKLTYHAYDINNDSVRNTEGLAEQLGLADHYANTGELVRFASTYKEDIRFDFITLTNTVHEVSPNEIATVLVDCVLRLGIAGYLFVYDMETLDPPELGAVPWRGADAKAILSALLNGLGCTGYTPPMGRWPHRTTFGWNATIERGLIPLTQEHIISQRETAIQNTSEAIQRTLRERLRNCKQALEKLTKHGAQTTEESVSRTHLLYEHWAISRALERAP